MSGSSAPRSRRATRLVAIAIAVVALLVVGVRVTRRPTVPAETNAEAPIAPTSASANDSDVRAPSPRIRGRIVDAEGNAVAGAGVHVMAATLPLRVLAETKSDPSGSFAIATLASPRARIRISAEHDPEGIVTSADLDAIEGTTTEVTLALAPSSVRGIVVDDEGKPIEGAIVSANDPPWIVPDATSDADGAFHFSALPAEVASVVAVARGYRTGSASLAKRTADTELVLRIRLEGARAVSGDVQDADGNPVRALVVACDGQPGAARLMSGDDGTFELPPSTIGCNVAAFSDDSGPSDPATVIEDTHVSLHLKPGGGVEGVVVDDRGNEIPSFTIGLESSSTAHGGVRAASKNFENTRGVFHWEKLAPGRYVFTVTAHGKSPTRSDPVDVAVGVVTRGVRIVMADGGQVTGHVYDARHAPIAGADLRFDAVSNVLASDAAAKTDDAGTYVLRGAPSGPFTLRVEKQGFRVRLISGLRVDSHGTLTQDIVLSDASEGTGFEFGGIGATLAQSRDGVSLASVMPGEVADRAGLRAGDHLRTIDGEDAESMGIADVLQRLRGPAGSTVGVSVIRPSTGEKLDVLLVRATIVH